MSLVYDGLCNKFNWIFLKYMIKMNKEKLLKLYEEVIWIIIDKNIYIFELSLCELWNIFI